MKKYIHIVLVSLLVLGLFFGDIYRASAMIMVTDPPCCSSVIFLPGMEGSRLYIPEGIFGENQLWEPNRNADVEKLYMDTNGQSIKTDVYTKDIIDESRIGGLNIYKTFEQSMDDMVVSGKIKEWKAFPYDWRKDASDIAIGGGNAVKTADGDIGYFSLANTVEQMSENSISHKITIIAHSNGGLIAKLLVQELERRDETYLVDKVILVAVPELGTPKAIPALLHGYAQSFAGGLLLNESVARGLGQNMQSAFNLLPSREYFNRVSDPVVVFDSSVDSISNLDQYGGKINSFDTLQSFLTGVGDGRVAPVFDDVSKPLLLGQNFLQKAESNHSLLDNWQFPAEIKVSQIAGWGLDTLSTTKYTVKKDCNADGGFSCVDTLDEEPVFTKDGDNTVITASATAVDAPNTQTYYVDLPKHNAQLFGLRRNRGHADILEVAELQQLIKNIISNSGELPNLITLDKPESSSNVAQNSVQISVHSPVSLDVYDSVGNHTGLVANPDLNSDLKLVEENIPNSFYLNFGEGKYVGVPAEASTNIKLQGLDYGTFTLNVGNSVFKDVAVTPETIAQVDSISSSSPQLVVDVDGDGLNDYTIKPSNNFDPALYLQSVRQMILSFNLKKTVEKNLLAKIDKLLFLIQEGKIAKADSKIHKLIFRTQNRKAKKISNTEKDQLVENLNQLLDNIN